MKTRPIIFDEISVQAILNGDKTQTRRIIKPGKPSSLQAFIYRDSRYCPYGQLGDRLWVREVWRIGSWNYGLQAIAVDYKADNYCRKEWLYFYSDKFNQYALECTNDAIKAGLKPDGDGFYHWKIGEAPTHWRSPIHMPRLCSRIDLVIINTRVEKLQEITDDDCKAEGYEYSTFKERWNAINAKRGFGWETNPFVWVINFWRL